MGVFHGMEALVDLLQETERQDPHSADRLLPQVYEELRRIAKYKLASQPAGQTLQPTALVHEAFLRLVSDPMRTWADRRHFFAAATETMRHILVDRARHKAATRHGGGLQRIDLEEGELVAEETAENVVCLHEALERLAQHDAEAAEIVHLRYFGGFTFAQVAEIVGISERTAKRSWAYARVWLEGEMQQAKRPGR